MERRGRINIGIYDSEVRVIFTDSMYNSVMRIFKRGGYREQLANTTEENVGSGYFLSDDGDIGHYIILLPIEMDHFLMVHESIHAAVEILHHHEIKFDVTNHDSLTYLSSYISDNVYKMYKKKKRI